MDALWIIIIGSLVAISCSLIGSFLIVQNIAMIGDAISHSILPGIVIAHILTQKINHLTSLIGAIIFGILSTFLIEILNKKGKVYKDASIGLVFTTSFSMGVILAKLFANNTDLDTNCILFGDISFATLDLLKTKSGINLGPVSFWILSIVLISLLFFLFKFYRALFLVSFDKNYSSSIGISPFKWNLILMVVLSIIVVVSFEIVGSILVIAFLVIPPTIAQLLTKRLPLLMLVSTFIGIICVISGYYIASIFDVTITGTIVVFSGFLLMAIFFINFKNKKKLKYEYQNNIKSS